MRKQLSGTRDIAKIFKRLAQEVKKSVKILLASEEEASGSKLIQKLIEGEGSPDIFTTLILSKDLSSGEVTNRTAEADVVLVLLDGTRPISQPVFSFISFLQENSSQGGGRPFLVIVDKIEVVDTEQLTEHLELLNVAETDIIFISTALDVGLKDELASRLAELCSDKDISLAARLPLLRKPVADEVIRRTAWQNGLIGAITFLPGTDMPVLTANQIKMVLELAAVYGEKINFERAKEILVVVGGGFTFRAIARQFLSFLPGPGWVIKGGVAYSGTVAIGKAAQRYFETDLAELSWLGKRR